MLVGWLRNHDFSFVATPFTAEHLSISIRIGFAFLKAVAVTGYWERLLLLPGPWLRSPKAINYLAAPGTSSNAPESGGLYFNIGYHGFLNNKFKFCTFFGGYPHQ